MKVIKPGPCSLALKTAMGSYWLIAKPPFIFCLYLEIIKKENYSINELNFTIVNYLKKSKSPVPLTKGRGGPMNKGVSPPKAVAQKGSAT